MTTARLARKTVLGRYPWLKDQGRRMVVSTHLDGLLCAAFLHHQLAWDLGGYTNGTSLWLSREALEDPQRLVWVDIDICAPAVQSLGHSRITLAGSAPPGLEHCCNPNLLAGRDALSSAAPYPYSTIIFLLWLHDVTIPHSLMARLLILQAGAVWLNIQHAPDQSAQWRERLPGYDWPWLFAQVDTEMFERRVRDELYPPLRACAPLRSRGGRRGRHLQLPLAQPDINPDWDEDALMNLGGLIGTHLKWSPPHLPVLARRIDGQIMAEGLETLRDKDFPTNQIQNSIISCFISSRNKLNLTLINL